MVQTTDLRNTDDAPLFGRLHRSWFGCVLVQRQVTAAVMVIVEKRLQMARQAGLVENNHVIQALATNRANDPFDIRPLPGRARSGQDLFDSHGLDLIHKFLSKDSIAIAQEIAGCRVPGERFPELVSGPLRGWMCRDSKMQNAPAVVCQHQKHVEDLKADRRHGEKVDRNQALYMVFQKGPPGLRGWFSPTDHVFAHAGFSDVDAKLQKLAVNPRGAPEWFFTTHDADPFANLLRNARPARLAPPNLPAPEKTEAFPVPSHHGRRLDQKDVGPPFLPDGRDPDPQESIRRGQFRPLPRALQNAELVAKDENLCLERRPDSEGCQESREQCRKYRRVWESTKE